MELAPRVGPGSSKELCSLVYCVEKYVQISSQQQNAWKVSKDNGEKLFDPQKGGSYEVWNERPLKDKIETYCLLEVHYLPKLREKYWDNIDAGLKTVVDMETIRRLLVSQSPSYQPYGEHKRLGPW